MKRHTLKRREYFQRKGYPASEQKMTMRKPKHGKLSLWLLLQRSLAYYLKLSRYSRKSMILKSRTLLNRKVEQRNSPTSLVRGNRPRRFLLSQDGLVETAVVHTEQATTK